MAGSGSKIGRERWKEESQLSIIMTGVTSHSVPPALFLSFLITALPNRPFHVISEFTVTEDGWCPVDRHKRLRLVFMKAW